MCNLSVDMILKHCQTEQYWTGIERELLENEGIKQYSFFLGIMAFNLKYKWISLVLGSNVPSVRYLGVFTVCIYICPHFRLRDWQQKRANPLI